MSTIGIVPTYIVSMRIIVFIVFNKVVICDNLSQYTLLTFKPYINVANTSFDINQTYNESTVITTTSTRNTMHRD